MTKLIKLVIIAIAALAVSGVAVASAAASPLFEAEKYPVEIKTINASKNNTFKIAGAVSDCEEATFKSKSYAAASATVSVVPTYKECYTQIGAEVYKTTVEVKGCEYEFTTGKEVSAGKFDDGTVSIVNCPKADPIEVKVESEAKALICEVKVNEEKNSGLKEVEYENKGSASLRHVEVKANVTGISYEVKGCPEGIEAGSEGEYRLGTEIKKAKPTEVKLLTGPVTAEVGGYEPGTTKRIGVLIG